MDRTLTRPERQGPKIESLQLGKEGGEWPKTKPADTRKEKKKRKTQEGKKCIQTLGQVGARQSSILQKKGIT